MAAEDDKYPPESGRRQFVKGVVGSAALAGIGTASAATINSATEPSGAGGGIIQYFGVENTDGPAPRSMPQVPIQIDDEGYLQGLWPEASTEMVQGQEVTLAETQLGGITYTSEWFQYCGVQTYPGVEPDADQDNYFRYTESPPYEWQQEEVEGGDQVHVDDFADYESWGNEIGDSGVGKPAMATWRSQDVPASGTLPVQIIRSPRVEQMARNDEWLSASTQQGFIANLNKCTHFCCVPAFKAYADSAQFGGADRIYCQCHQSVYDPFSIVQESFVALPRPDWQQRFCIYGEHRNTLKRTLLAVVARVKRLFGSSASGPDEGATDRDAGPDLFECDGCGVVFISRPSECSNCGGDDFSNIGTFQ